MKLDLAAILDQLDADEAAYQKILADPGFLAAAEGFVADVFPIVAPILENAAFSAGPGGAAAAHVALGLMAKWIAAKKTT